MRRNAKPVSPVPLILGSVFFFALAIACVWIDLVPNEGASQPGDFHVEISPKWSVLSGDVLFFTIMGAGLSLWGFWIYRARRPGPPS